MKTLMAAMCCLMLAASSVALAQQKSDAKKGPLTQKEMDDQKKAINMQAGMCAHRSRQAKLKQGSKEFHQFMSQCLAGK